MSDQITIEAHQKALAEAVKDALINKEIEALKDGINEIKSDIGGIQSDIKEHVIQSKLGYDNLKDFISRVSHEAEQRGQQCQQDLKKEFYGHLADKYATKEYVDSSVKYVKLAAIFGAVSFLSTLIGFVVIIVKLGGME